MNLESKRPPRPLFRVGRDDDAWAVPDWAYAKEDGTFGNRFDDPMRVYRVLYASSRRLGCFIETLARFRVDVSFVADLALMENGEDDFTAFGTVRKAWIDGRCIGTANVEGEYADIYALGWVSHLRSALARIPESRDEAAGKRLDWQGATLVTFGLGGITYALINGSATASGPEALIWILGRAGVGALLCFLFVESRSTAPMVSLHLFRSRDFSGANLLTFLLYAPLRGILFFFPLDLIQVQHYSATQAGAAVLPLILLIFILSRWSGGLVARYGARLPLTVGSLVAASGFALFLRPGIGGTYWNTFFPAVVVLGIGMATGVAPLTTAVMESVPSCEAGVASGVNNAVSRIAGLLAVAVFGLVLSAGFNRTLDRSLSRMQLSPSVRQSVEMQRSKLAGAQIREPLVMHAFDEAFVSGYRDAIWISVGMALLSALSAQMIRSKRRIVQVRS